MTVDTTFLPKTNGLVFGDRLVTRADKGRVFLLDLTPPADPTPPPTTIGTVSATVNGANYPMDGTAPVQTLSGTTLALATDITGDASPNYVWTVKQGSASLVGNGSAISATIDTVAPGAVQIQCDIIDANASDNPFSFRFFIVVGE